MKLERRLRHFSHRGVASGVEDEGSVSGRLMGTVRWSSPLSFSRHWGEVAFEVDFGSFFEEVTEAVFAIGFPLLEQVEGEDELALRIGDGDQGSDGVGAVIFELEGDAGHDQTIGGEVEELAGDEEQVAGTPGGVAAESTRSPPGP